jgi:phage terminase large subunit
MEVNRKILNSLTSGKPIVVHQGGTSSGKTYGILQYLFGVGANNDNEVITVVAEDVPNLKSGAYRDAKNIWADNDNIKAWWPYLNESDRLFKCVNGSVIEFKSFQDEYDARSGKRDRAFFNEANAIKYGIFEQINLRTSKQTIIDFNPSARFWAHDKLEGRDDVEWVITTFQDNIRHLSPSIVDKIKSYEPTPENIKRGTANEYRWMVYGEGKVGRLDGLVFPHFQTSSEWPEEYKWRTFGMDFGFTNDPTTLIEIRLSGGKLYVKEHIYRKGLTNQDISRLIKDLGITEQIIADSAEPKSIEELKREGIWVSPAQKGKDSIMYGIQRMNEYPIVVHTSSKNLIEEFSSYIWAKDRHGQATNKPIDDFNHGIDAIRYALTDKLRRKKLQFDLI